MTNGANYKNASSIIVLGIVISVLPISSTSQSKQSQSNMLCGWEDSVRDLASIWEEAICEASPSVRSLGLRAQSERGMKEAGFQSHSGHIHWVQHIH
jgi:hypothetical protein